MTPCTLPAVTEPDAERSRIIAEIIFQIRRLLQARSVYSKELDRYYHISAAQLNCILALYEHGPLLPSEIARHILVKSSTVTGIIDRLETKHLVMRVRENKDRRKITIQLTPQGMELASHAPPPIQQKIIDGLRELPPEQIDVIRKGLLMLTRMLDVQDMEVD